MATGATISSDGQLVLNTDPGVWIQNNPDYLLLVRKLRLYSLDDTEEIGESIGELTQLIRLDFDCCRFLKCVPNTIAMLHHLKYLNFCWCNYLEELPANIGQLVSLTHLYLSVCNNIKSLPMSLANLSNLTSLSLNNCNSLVELPANIGCLVSLTHLHLSDCKNIKSLLMSLANLSNLTSLSLKSCISIFTQFEHNLPVNCCNLNLPRGLRNLKYLSVTVCSCSHQSFENLKDSDSLQHLVILGCHSHYKNNIIKLPASFNQLVNLQVLSLDYRTRFVELPANLNGLAKLCVVDIQKSNNKCLPWSITTLGSLRLLMLPFDFRLHTLPSELNDQVIISVIRRHVRKTWKEIKEEISFSEVRLKMAVDAPQHSSITFPSGYLRLEGDPGPWIRSNYDSLMLVQILELEDLKKRNEYSIANWTQLNELTHLYISGCNCFPDNYFATNTRLKHLSLECRDKKSLIHSLSNDSLSKLSNLETLHIDLKDIKLPANINFPASIKYLSLHHGNMKSLHDSLAKLPNLKTIELCVFRNLNLFPTNLYRAKVRLIDCPIKSLPTGLLHLEIFCRCNPRHDCETKVGQLYKLANLQTLSITCNRMELIRSMAGLRNLKNFELKDCFSLKELPSYLGELVSLRNLDISGTRIKSLPGSIMELCNLQHLILPGCFSLETLPRNLKEVFTIDNTHETYYKRMGYFDSRFQASTEWAIDGIGTAQGCTQTQGRESCNEDDNIVPVAGVDETVSAEQTSANDIPIYLSKILFEPITSEQGAISQVHKDSQFNGRKDLINENSQYVACSSQNQFPSSGSDDFVRFFYEDFTTEQIFNTVTSENERLLTNFNVNKILDGYRLKYNCSMQSPTLVDLINAEHLDISLCVCSEELVANLKNSSLGHLAIKYCKQQHHVKEFPANFNEFANLQTLSIRGSNIKSLPSFVGLRNLQKLYLGGDGASRLEEFPADLDKLNKLLAVDIHDTKIKCLPWSVMKLLKLRFLFLPLDFRLETLPCQLNESVVITVDSMHIRKTWKELRSEMRTSSLHGVGMEASQNSSIFSRSGYLRMKEHPKEWSKRNIDSFELVQSLELELPDNIKEIGDSIWKLSKLTYLYISGNYRLHLKHLPDTSMTLRHLSLHNCNIKSLPDSLGKLSNLKSLCLDLQNINLPDNLDLLVNLRHLSLHHGKEQSDFDNIAKLSNLKALDLFQCDLESLSENLNLAALKLSGSDIRSLPTSLHRLEILHDKEICERTKCDVTSLNLEQLINMQKLSVTCNSMELLPSIERMQNLQELQLKDCSSLEALPKYLGGLVKLCTLDISGTRIKSLPDNITKLQYLILPKCFQQDCSHQYLRKEFNKVFVDDTVELYFNDRSYDDDDDYDFSMETSNESNGIELDSVEGNNEAISKELEEGIINTQSSPHRLHVTPILEENSNPEGQSIPAIQNDQNDITTMEAEQGNGEYNHHASENGKGQNRILQNNMKGKKRNEITIETLQQHWSKGMTLEKAANENGISRSTMKRRLKDLNRKWPSRKKGKQRLDDAQKRKQNSKAPFGSNSTQQKLVNPTNSTAHAEIVGECIMGANQLTLPNHVSSNSNAVGNLTVVIVRENLMDAQGDMDSQHGEEHLDGANDQGHLEGILHSAESNLAATLETLEEPLMVTERHMDTQQQAKGHLDGALRSTESSGTIIVKATYKELSVRIVFPLTLTINQLIEEIGMKFQLEVNKYRLLYQDEDKEWMMLTCVEDLKYASNVAESLGTKFVRLSVIDYVV